MARRIVAAIAVLSVLSGCAHVHRVDPVASESDLDDLNWALRRRLVTVELVSRLPHRSGVKLRAERVHVAADPTFLTLLLEPGDLTAFWGEPRYGAIRDTTLSTSAIRRMTTTNRSRGALDGTLLGLGVGVALGVLWGVTSDDSYPVETRATIGGIVLGAVGTLVGLAAGASVGSKKIYDFMDR